MNSSHLFIAVSFTTLLILAIAFSIKHRSIRIKRLSPYEGFSFALILAGILFGQNQIIGYFFWGVGVILAIFDFTLKSKKPNS